VNGSGSTPVLLLAIHAISDADRERLDMGLRQLRDEDPTLSVETDQQTGEVTLGAVGELQLEIIVDRLKREFHVEATLGRPQVAYKEALAQAADGEGRYARQTGGLGQYGHAKIHVSPGESGTGYVFESVLVGGAIPNQFIEPIKDGIREASMRGVLAGYPIRDVRVELYDGSYHDIDSSEMAFKIAGAMAFQDAAKKAMPVLLEPVMHVEVVVPREYTADVVGNLSGRRAQIQSHDHRGDTQVIRAVVPLSEMFGYATDLRSRTQGRATHSLHFDHYQQVRSDPNRHDGDRDSLVGAPLRPVPRSNDSAVALPEPDDDSPET
jgi:elongation factor G